MGGRGDLAHVVVDGWGPLAQELTAQLRRCRVEVRGGTHAADGAEIALDADAVPPAVVAVVAQGRAPGWAGAPWQARGIPHLPLVLTDRTLVVGPLVVPGRSACLRCTRAAASGSDVGGADTPGGGVVLGAAVATVTVLAVLRGDLSLGGISTEIGLEEVAVTHRLWSPRPGCGCSRVRMAG
ncbi:MAG TPA: hypothetical protein VFU25_10275 [Ornithinibacter sp.]|nr:hypothetical protein [Ornithinibacter sp.]